MVASAVEYAALISAANLTQNNNTNARSKKLINMKTINLLTLTVVTGSLLAFTTKAGIIGSKHDFSNPSQYSFNNNPADPNTVCSVCHTPHHADANSGPLWGHDSVSAAPAYWTMYAKNGAQTSPGANVKYIVPTAPNPSSLACLSCHDGSVAINAYGDPSAPNGAPNRANPISLSGIYAISEQSGNLSHSHPISFKYSDVVGFGTTKDQFIYPQDNSVLQPLPGSSSTFTPGPDMSIKGFLLDGQGNLECSSCHDVHGQLGSAYDARLNPSLLKINGTAANTINGQQTGSLLCRSCHNK